jgi:hypothetical protein
MKNAFLSFFNIFNGAVVLAAFIFALDIVDLSGPLFLRCEGFVQEQRHFFIRFLSPELILASEVIKHIENKLYSCI